MQILTDLLNDFDCFDSIEEMNAFNDSLLIDNVSDEDLIASIEAQNKGVEL